MSASPPIAAMKAHRVIGRDVPEAAIADFRLLGRVQLARSIAALLARGILGNTA
jgi:hypothetical protein